MMSVVPIAIVGSNTVARLHKHDSDHKQAGQEGQLPCFTSTRELPPQNYLPIDVIPWSKGDPSLTTAVFPPRRTAEMRVGVPDTERIADKSAVTDKHTFALTSCTARPQNKRSSSLLFLGGHWRRCESGSVETCDTTLGFASRRGQQKVSPVARVVGRGNTVSIHVATVVVHARSDVDGPHSSTAEGDLIALFQPCSFSLVPVCSQLTSPSLDFNTRDLTIVSRRGFEKKLKRFAQRDLSFCTDCGEQNLRTCFGKNVGEFAWTEISRDGADGEVSCNSAKCNERPDDAIRKVEEHSGSRCMNRLARS